MSFHDHRNRFLRGTFLDLETKADEGGEEPNVEKAVADLTAAFETKMADLDKQVKAQKDRADALEAKMNRPGGREDKAEMPLEQKAFLSYMRTGRDHMPAEELKVLRVADDVSGGYVVAPDTFLSEILKDVADINPIRRLARVTSISTGGVKIPRRLSGPAAWWVDEIEERSATDATYGQANIPVHEAASYIDVSEQLLEDSAVNLEAELRADFADAFAELEAEAFTIGNGVKQPMGFMADAGVQDVPSGHASQITPDALIDLVYGVPANVRRSAVWGMSLKTMSTIRKLKDPQGNYLWQPGLTADQPSLLLGRPVEEFPNMDDVAAGNRPIVFGDFNDAYRIFDRVNIVMKRDPFTLATRGQVRFHFRRRVGGGVVKPDSLRTMKIGTAV